MASSTYRVTKAELIKKLSDYKDKDYVGVLAAVQDGKENPCHEVLIFFKALDDLV